MPKTRLGVAVGEVELRGCLIAEHKSCGKANCRCARGELHGPYYYRRWRDESGRQRKEYVPRDQARQVRQALERTHSRGLWAQFRELRKSIDELSKDSARARQRACQGLGLHWHGRTLRKQRSVPDEQRDRALYRAKRECMAAALGWQITEDDFVELQRMIRSERKRRNRMRKPWREIDPASGEPTLRLTLDLRGLPSYRDHVASKAHTPGGEVKGNGKAES